MPGDKYIAWCYKSGSASIRFATQWERLKPKAPIWEVYYRTRQGDASCVLFLRHPLTRLRSSWRWWSQQRNFPQPAYGPHCLWEKFVDLVLKDRPETRDPHWNPQLDAHKFEGEVVPTVILPFEEIDLHWRDWCKKPLPEMNQTGGGKDAFPDYRREELEAYYAEDLAVWNRTTTT
jgi:hypothetical protein